MKAFRIGISLASVAALLAIPAGAQAQVTIGEVGALNLSAGCTGPKFELAPSNSSSYEVPNAGVITSWSTSAAAGPGQQLTFKILRPFEGGYLVVTHDTRPLLSGVINTFKTAIPVRGGDLLGLNKANGASVDNACLLQGGAGDSVDISGPEVDVADGFVWQIAQTLAERRLNVRATLLEPPKVSSIGTDPHGSVTGGTSVTISGEHLAEIQNVTFDEIPSTSITATSENQITVIAPPHNFTDDATVVVRTLAGSATALQSFTYEGCEVPNLVHKRLTEAKRRLKTRDCRLGKVKKLRGHSRKPPKVVKQSPRAGGKLLAPGAKVNVTVTG